MTKGKISKQTKSRLMIFGPISFVFIIVFVVSLLYNIATIYNLTLEKKHLEKKYLELQEKAEQLKIDIEKFNDEQYLANYVREHYSYSKEGEYIIKIIDDVNETNETLDDITIEINKNYILMALSTLFILMVIFIIIRTKNKRN